MKKILAFASILSIALFTLTGCKSPDNAKNDPSAINAIPNLIVKAEGHVYLRRIGWTDFFPVGLGTSISPGDLIKAENGATVEIFCGDQIQWTDSPHTLESDGIEHGVPCRAGSPPRPWPDTAALRSEKDNFIPYVIYPRNTALLNSTPALRWFALPDVTSYTISILSDDQLDRAPLEIQGAHTAWPDAWPPIEAGATYVLIVNGNGHLSDSGNQEHTRLGFWLLSPGEQQEIHILKDQLLEKPISTGAADLLIAELYLQFGLVAEAIQLLENNPLLETSSALNTKLGQLFLETDLPLESKLAFERSLALAQENGESEAIADAHYGLGLVYGRLEDHTEAAKELEKALDLYKLIGASEKIEQTETQLDN